MATEQVTNGKISVYELDNTPVANSSNFIAASAIYGPLELPNGDYKVIASSPTSGLASKARIIKIDDNTPDEQQLGTDIVLAPGKDTYNLILETTAGVGIIADVVPEVNLVFPTNLAGDKTDGTYTFNGDNKLPLGQSELIVKVLNEADYAPLEKIITIDTEEVSQEIRITPKLNLIVSVRIDGVNTMNYDVWLRKNGALYKKFTPSSAGKNYSLSIWEGTHDIAIVDISTVPSTVKKVVTHNIEYVDNVNFSLTIPVVITESLLGGDEDARL